MPSVLLLVDGGGDRAWLTDSSLTMRAALVGTERWVLVRAQSRHHEALLSRIPDGWDVRLSVRAATLEEVYEALVDQDLRDLWDAFALPRRRVALTLE